ncbi:MAG: GNAT family N-acetyltransferase [Pseudomonadota bacterium]
MNALSHQPKVAIYDRNDGKDGWQTLWEDALACCDHGYFQSWAWINRWLVELPPEIPVFLIRAECHSGFAMGIFTFRRRKRWSIVDSRAVHLHRSGHCSFDSLTPEYNALLSNSDNPNLLLSLLDALPINWNEAYFTLLDLRRYPGSILNNKQLGNYRVTWVDQRPSYYVELDKVRDCDGDYPATIGSQIRQQLRASTRKAEKCGALRIEQAESLVDAQAIFSSLVELHQLAWQRRGEKGAFHDAWFRTFHQNLIAERMRYGEIQLLRILCGDHVLGCVYNFVYQNEVLYYQSGFDYEHFSQLRPGLLSHKLAIEFNAARGRGSYNFLAGEVRYKRSLATNKHILGSSVIQKRDAGLAVERWARKVRSACSPGRQQQR